MSEQACSVLFSNLLKMIVLGSSGCEWLGLLCFQACWKWLSLALQWASDWACFVVKPAENGCSWLYRGWVTGLALFSSLLRMIILGSLGCEWLSLPFFQAFWKWLFFAHQSVSDWACFVCKLTENGCPWLSSGWVTEFAFFSSLLTMMVLDSLGGKWLSLLYLQGCWK